MDSKSQNNTSAEAEASGTQMRPIVSETEQDIHGWTIVSPPGSSVIVRQRPLPNHIREAIARNLGIGTGTPREQ